MSTLKPAFTIKLGHKIVPNTVRVGKFDGIHPSLTAATAGSKVFLHTPHRPSNESEGRLLRSDVADVALLNINQIVKAVAVGKLQLGANKDFRDVVVVGTPTHALAYDVDNNSDLFYKEVPDGVNCIVIGKMGGIEQPIAICGGNCAIQGFDATGHDPFWTVTGDNVTALCLCDFDGDGKLELVVGSEDFDIRVFKGDEILAEITETEAITGLFWTGIASQFAYSLANGTLGLYEGINRLWRIKSKNQAVSMAMFDIDGDGELELAVGWTSGKLDFRSITTGDVVLKEQFSSSMAGVVVADYRMDGHEQLICCSVDGDARGYLSPSAGGVILQNDPTQEILHDIGMRKQNLMAELNNYEESRRMAQMSPGSDAQYGFDMETLGAIPTNTHLQTTLYVNPGSPEVKPCVELELVTSNDSLIRTVMVFAEGIFAGESHVVHPNLQKLSPTCRVQLRPEKDIAVDLHVKTLVGFRNSVQFHVFELSRAMPRFSMYALCNENAPAPRSNVVFQINERPQRLALWVNENFLLQEDVQCDAHDGLSAKFYSLRGSGMLFITMDANGKCSILCDDMGLAGDIVQAVAEFFGIKDLSSIADFPFEIEKLMALLEKVNDIYAVRDRLSADMADHSSLIKGLIIRAEDSRLMGDMATMRRYFTQLYNLNQELLAQYKVRCNNHEELLTSLKKINQIIQRAGRLRVGKPKSDLVSACRSAIKENQTDLLPKIIHYGSE